MVLCDALEGWHGGWGGREFQEERDIHTLAANSHCYTQKSAQYCKAVILQFKKREKRKGEGEGGAIFPLFPSFLKFFRLAIKHFYYAH